ncbi:MAG: FAD-dependent thymidylate synthase [Dehalococcoidia bacterium]|nr:FAD-dependent thymidylate synthase [Dehalococcoidia bacterium]
MKKENNIDQEQLAEINELRKNSYTTLRATSPEVEEILYKPMKVLDHGFVRVVDYMGNDSAIVQAARVSYGKGTKKVSEDAGLIKYLMRHSHSTPFEMCEIKLHVKLPIFIARQWVRHRTANINEYSARYSILDKEFYIPNENNLGAQSSNNRQGRDAVLSGQEATDVLEILKNDASQAYENYEKMMNIDKEGNALNSEKIGLARELARMNLSLNYYTQWYWKIDLHNLLHFLRLRADTHAQLEIREYADVILNVVEKWVPETYNAFVEYQLNGVKLSSTAWGAIKSLVNGKLPTHEELNISKREWNELKELLDGK